MTHDEALEAISAAADGELDDDAAIHALEEHLAGCPTCAAFDATVRHVRSELRFEAVDDLPALLLPDLPAPDLPAEPEPAEREEPADTTTVRSLRRFRTARADRQSRPLWIAAAAAAVVGIIAGAAFAGLGDEATPPAAADDFSDLILDAQHDITTLDAEFVLSEYGRGVTGAERHFDGRLLYEAPEWLRLTLTETGAASALAAGNVDLVVAGERRTLDSVRTCECAGGSDLERWREEVTGREPFSEAHPIPLELVTAVDGFALAEEPEKLGARTVGGVQATGVRVTAAQVSGFLAGLSPADDLRDVHPTDPVDVWFEAEHLVPVAVEVRAADSQERAEWARIKSYDDQPGDAVLTYEVRTLRVNAPDVKADAPPAEPEAATAKRQSTTEGFRPGEPAVVPTPDNLPEGLREHLTGTVSTPGGPTVGVRSWTDGRAWVKVRATEEWNSTRLFGDLGLAAHPVDLGAAGTAYVDGHKVALHGEGLDVVVSGSLSTEQLEEIAAGLGVTGQPIPDAWPEAANATLDEAAPPASGVLVPAELEGFAPPGVRVEDGLVVQVYTGPGERGFVLAQSDEAELSLPSDAKTMGVRVRGTSGRYGYDDRELEWAENGQSFSLSSSTLSLAELVAIAEGLTPR